jgi:hypothetical protein
VPFIYYPCCTVPETVNLAIFSPPGAVVTVLLPGETVNSVLAGPLRIITPPDPAAPGPPGIAPPPPPDPRSANAAVPPD